MPNNMKWAKKPYKHGGHTVPGMFQEGGAPKKRNWFGRQGARIGNIFRSDKNDRSIQYQGYKNPQVGSGPTNPWKGTTNKIGVNQGIGGGPPAPGPRRPVYKPGVGNNQSFRSLKRGGSTGPNGVL